MIIICQEINMIYNYLCKKLWLLYFEIIKGKREPPFWLTFAWLRVEWVVLSSCESLSLSLLWQREHNDRDSWERLHPHHHSSPCSWDPPGYVTSLHQCRCQRGTAITLLGCWHVSKLKPCQVNSASCSWGFLSLHCYYLLCYAPLLNQN